MKDGILEVGLNQKILNTDLSSFILNHLYGTCACLLQKEQQSLSSDKTRIQQLKKYLIQIRNDRKMLSHRVLQHKIEILYTPLLKTLQKRNYENEISRYEKV